MSEQVISYADVAGIKLAIAEVGHIAQVVSHQVGELHAHQVRVADRLDTLANAFAEFVRNDAKHKELQLAETRLLKVRQELEQRFGHHVEVRHRATGILQAVDNRLVSQETLRHTTEDVMMKAPGYWLAPTLVSMAAWMRNDRALALRALEESLRRDDFKTSLFFTLVTRRLGRMEATHTWFCRYLAHQDPTALDREFVVLLDGVASGLFGPAIRKSTADAIESWLDTLGSRDTFVADQEARWAEALAALKPAVGGTDYPVLQRYSPTWPRLAGSLSDAKLHGKVIGFFEGIFAGEIATSPKLSAEIDGILQSLVSNFDDEELPLRSQERFLQLVVDHAGDRDAAKAAFELERKGLVEKIGFTELLTAAAMTPEVIKSSLGTRRLAVAISRPWIVSAHEALAAKARAKLPQVIELDIDGWTGTTRDGANETALRESLDAHFTELEEAAVKEVGFGMGATWGFILAALSICLTVIGSLGWLLVAAIGGVLVWTGFRKRTRDREQVRDRCRERAEKAGELLRAACAEVVDYRAELAREDARAEEAHAILEAINPEQCMLNRPGGARAVLN
jgi:hypothetical protein